MKDEKEEEDRQALEYSKDPCSFNSEWVTRNWNVFAAELEGPQSTIPNRTGMGCALLGRKNRHNAQRVARGEGRVCVTRRAKVSLGFLRWSSKDKIDTGTEKIWNRHA